ncbi:YwmB family TATA-box binding protein [Paenibacillus allorhizosphaerae]|uniref:YwmB family TATA-box binding protein n=1 Tax=Paenibacillus allorhizosphaerae TaxID=2849866 RepID=A0ABM8VNQ4_9BACL|nr:YwmB family TATA-box binding protein [Paenibacillus allorhizosphaerae]CAG7651790.1 hypothetical protein PAECIP111802_05071 [Paenibacillus allorhizosphaerae]
MRTKSLKTVCLLMVIGILGWWLLQSERGLARPELGASEDTMLLLKTAEQTMSEDTPIRLVMKKNGPFRPYNSNEDLLRLGQEWSRLLGIPELSALAEQQGEAVYREEWQTIEGCTQTLLLAGLGAGQSYAIVKSECPGLPFKEMKMKAAVIQETVERQLEKIPFEGVWNVMIQGMLREQSGEGAQEALRNVQGQLRAKAVERYEDTGTVSISYTSNVLHHSVDSGSQKIHLQAAVHRDSFTNAWRLTIGTPVITIEY